ncbi:tyrosine-type recombinase/integrase [Paenibacillus sp. 1A_MP2]|uniref:tyrosine-type recombinase/integrase n=1 Tax=Paenibacillus sp. 1A_MP2 TaxID=3457495 RepID=UPI003FCE146D
MTEGPLMYRNLAIINIFVYAGLKVAEVAALKTTPDSYWVDLNQNCIWCEDVKVPLAAELRSSLTEWLSVRGVFLKSSQDSLFLSKRGKPMSIRLLQHTLESYYLPGIKITPEILRHTFAKWLLLGRYEEKVVKTLLRVEQSRYLDYPEGIVIPDILVFEGE